MDKKHKSDSGQKRKKTVKKDISDTDIVITSSKLKRDIYRILMSTEDMKKLTPRLIKDELKKSYKDEVIDKYNKLIKGWIKELYSELSKNKK